MNKKVIILIFVSIILVSFLSGCNDETNQLIGTWDLEVPEDEEAEYDYSFTYTFYENMSLKVSYYMEFLGDEPYYEWGTYSVNGNQLCINQSDDSTTCATYEILEDGNILQLIDPDNPNEEPVIFNRVN